MKRLLTSDLVSGTESRAEDSAVGRPGGGLDLTQLGGEADRLEGRALQARGEGAVGV